MDAQAQTLRTEANTRPVAVLYRMATPDHLCPFGLKAKDLLQRRGYHVEDHLLTRTRRSRPSRKSTA